MSSQNGTHSRTPERKSLPTHVAMIMDGNGRWAESRGLKRLAGHAEGAKAVRRVVEACRKQGVRYLTLFSFSTENWNRSSDEVTGLMELFATYLKSELPTLQKNNIRLRAIGNLERLPQHVLTSLTEDMEATKANDGLDLILAVSYGGREDILHAAKRLATLYKNGEINLENVDNEFFSDLLWTADIPHPDLLIRTSGEMRISNFLLWQLAYSEIIVTNTLWPDFDEEALAACLEEYARRERRFGLTREQLLTQNELGAYFKD